MTALLRHPKVTSLLSDEHFSVDGTLIEAWASFKSFKPKDGPDDTDGSDFHKQKRGNDSHASTTDGDRGLPEIRKTNETIEKTTQMKTDKRA